MALPLIAISYTRDPFLVSLVSVCLYLPWLLFALPAGAYADRLDRRRIVIAGQGVRFLALALFAVAVVTGVSSFWLLCVLALILGTGEMLFEQTASAMLPMVVPRDQLERANGRLFGIRQLLESFVGQAGGGLLISLATAVAVTSTSALFGVAVVALLLISGTYQPLRPAQKSIRQDIAEGVSFLLRHRVLRMLAVMSGMMNLANTAFMAVFVLYVVGPGSPMGLPEWAYGLLLTVTAVGAIAGSLLAAGAERRFGRVPLIAAVLVSPIVAQAVPALTANVVAVAVAFIVHGAGIAMWNVVVVSLRQRIIPDELLGRVNSCYALLSWGTMPVGALLGGVLAGWVGLRAMFAIVAVLSATLLIGMRVLTERNISAAEAATAVRAAP